MEPTLALRRCFSPFSASLSLSGTACPSMGMQLQEAGWHKVGARRWSRPWLCGAAFPPAPPLLFASQEQRAPCERQLQEAGRHKAGAHCSKPTVALRCCLSTYTSASLSCSCTAALCAVLRGEGLRSACTLAQVQEADRPRARALFIASLCPCAAALHAVLGGSGLRELLWVCMSKCAPGQRASAFVCPAINRY